MKTVNNTIVKETVDGYYIGYVDSNGAVISKKESNKSNFWSKTHSDCGFRVASGRWRFDPESKIVWWTDTPYNWSDPGNSPLDAVEDHLHKKGYDVNKQQNFSGSSYKDPVRAEQMVNESYTEEDVGRMFKLRDLLYTKLIEVGYTRNRGGGRLTDGSVEHYIWNFVTTTFYVIEKGREYKLVVEKYYDNERLDHFNKTWEFPFPKDEAAVDKFVVLGKKLMNSAKGDESLFGGMDDMNENDNRMIKLTMRRDGVTAEEAKKLLLNKKGLQQNESMIVNGGFGGGSEESFSDGYTKVSNKTELEVPVKKKIKKCGCPLCVASKEMRLKVVDDPIIGAEMGQKLKIREMIVKMVKEGVNEYYGRTTMNGKPKAREEHLQNESGTVSARYNGEIQEYDFVAQVRYVDIEGEWDDEGDGVLDIRIMSIKPVADAPAVNSDGNLQSMVDAAIEQSIKQSHLEGMHSV